MCCPLEFARRPPPPQGESLSSSEDDGAMAAPSTSAVPTHFFPRRRTESYPLHLALNFQQLPQESLSQYYSHFHLRSRPDATEGELAVGVAQHFDQFFELKPAETEDAVINAFVMRYKNEKRPHSRRQAGRQAAAAAAGADGDGGGGMEVGDQVAAKIGSDWILGLVTKTFPSKGKVQVEDLDSDDDDSGKQNKRYHMLGPSMVKALTGTDEEGASLGLHSRVMAVYPQTTSFYPGTVVQAPRSVTAARLVIKFDDDEDADTGVTAEHRIQRTHVLPLSR